MINHKKLGPIKRSFIKMRQREVWKVFICIKVIKAIHYDCVIYRRGNQTSFSEPSKLGKLPKEYYWEEFSFIRSVLQNHSWQDCMATTQRAAWKLLVTRSHSGVSPVQFSDNIKSITCEKVMPTVFCIPLWIHSFLLEL